MTPASLSAAWILVTEERHIEAAIAFRQMMNDRHASAHDRQHAAFGLGSALAFLGEFDEARLIFTRLRTEAATRNDLTAEHRALHQVGMVERLAERWAAAQACFVEEQQLIERLGSPDLAVAINAYELGFVALQWGDAATSRGWFEQSLSRAQNTTDLVAVGCAYRGLGDWAAAQGYVQDAIERWTAAQQAFVQAGEAKAGDEVQLRIQKHQHDR